MNVSRTIVARRASSSKARVAKNERSSPSSPVKARPTPARSPSPAPKEPSSALEAWQEAAWRLPDGRLRTRVPLQVLLDEAVDLARFFRDHFATVRGEDGAVLRLGLDTVAGPGRKLSATSGADLLSLRDAVQEAQSSYLLSIPRRDRTAEVRARVVLRELRAALSYLFDDGVVDRRDAQLESVARSTGGSRSVSALASDIGSTAALADRYRAELDGLGGFDVRLIDEGKALFNKVLLASPSGEVPPRPPVDPGAALGLRNRLVTLLTERMTTIRDAARFVFRGSPPIVREATSPYERRRRNASRRAEKEKRTAAARLSSERTDLTTPAAATLAPPGSRAEADGAPKRRRRK